MPLATRGSAAAPFSSAAPTEAAQEKKRMFCFLLLFSAMYFLEQVLIKSV